jgi:hypothetical protein
VESVVGDGGYAYSTHTRERGTVSSLLELEAKIKKKERKPINDSTTV